MSIYTSVSISTAVVAVVLIAFLALRGKIDYKSGGLWNSLQICVIINAMMSMLGEMLTMLGFAQLYWTLVAIGALLIVIKIVSSIRINRSVASYRNGINSEICFESYYGVGRIDTQKYITPMFWLRKKEYISLLVRTYPKMRLCGFCPKTKCFCE